MTITLYLMDGAFFAWDTLPRRALYKLAVGFTPKDFIFWGTTLMVNVCEIQRALAPVEMKAEHV